MDNAGPNTQRLQHLQDVEVILTTSGENLSEERLREIADWMDFCGLVRIVAFGERPATIPKGLVWEARREEETKTELWNRLSAASMKPWVLFLDKGESIRPDSCPDPSGLNRSCWPPVQLACRSSSGWQYLCQIRMVPVIPEPIFEGLNFPDATRFIFDHSITLSESVVRIRSIKQMAEWEDPEAEQSGFPDSPRALLGMANRSRQKERYAEAASYYRRTLKSEKLLPFDRLAAVNGLAYCFAEQYKWDRALILANESVDAEPLQWTPYLIRFRIFQLRKEWKDAFKSLQGYNQVKDTPSRSNYEYRISDQEMLHFLIETGIRAGVAEEVFNYSDQLVSAMGDEPADPVLARSILVHAVELSDRRRAHHFFQHWFGSILESPISSSKASVIDEFMTLFMEQGWYKLVADVYQKRLAAEPGREEYRRRLIVALSRSDQLKEARAVLSGSR